jgi:hypothetical protein
MPAAATTRPSRRHKKVALRLAGSPRVTTLSVGSGWPNICSLTSYWSDQK